MVGFSSVRHRSGRTIHQAGAAAAGAGVGRHGLNLRRWARRRCASRSRSSCSAPMRWPSGSPLPAAMRLYRAGLSAAGIVVAGAAAMVVFGVLAAIALRPLRGIEAVASRVWRGDFGARVGASAVADRDIKRIGTTFNLLLDGLVADRTRMRSLATAVIDAGDRERASLARELARFHRAAAGGPRAPAQRGRARRRTIPP